MRDAPSNLVESIANPGDGVESTATYLYDASGQRVARLGDTNGEC